VIRGLNLDKEGDRILPLAMLDTHPCPTEPSLVDSVVRILQAGQRVVLDRVDR
jgi:hypothetical protein